MVSNLSVLLLTLGGCCFLNLQHVFVSGYNLQKTYVGEDFYRDFDFFNDRDPTHGRVDYVDLATAQSQNLTSVSGSSFILRADSVNKVNFWERGRKSVRISSRDTYTTHVAVFEVLHMPEGCGTWPSIWEVGDNWPIGGEIDIIEGVNDVSPNSVALHTSAGCQMPPIRRFGRIMTGTQKSTNCNSYTSNNQGCVVTVSEPNSYGPAFNKAGGGWYALERTDTYVNVYFWSKSSGNVPADIKNHGNVVNPATWGTPDATFVNQECDINSHLSRHSIVINLTFCGDWAGATFSGQCGWTEQTCNDFVDDHPEDFKKAYFDIASIRIYT